MYRNEFVQNHTLAKGNKQREEKNTQTRNSNEVICIINSHSLLSLLLGIEMSKREENNDEKRMACIVRGLASARIQWQQEKLIETKNDVNSLLHIYTVRSVFPVEKQMIKHRNKSAREKERERETKRESKSLWPSRIQYLHTYFTVCEVTAVSHLTSKWNSITLKNYSVYFFFFFFSFVCCFYSQIWQIQFSLSVDTSSTHRGLIQNGLSHFHFPSFVFSLSLYLFLSPSFEKQNISK